MSRDEIESRVISALKDLTSDWDIEPSDGIGSKTRLIADLEFESIDVVQLAVSIEEAFGQQNLPFEKLFMVNGDYVAELEVRQVVDFLSDNLPPID